VVTVFIPAMFQSLTSGVTFVEIDASNVRDVIQNLDNLFPGLQSKLIKNGHIKEELAVSIDGDLARMGLMEKVPADSEIHFIPAIAGGI
jgi:molybdopterin synthase sulfur carrier subunit|tara:strand:- start:447 stop:713 length:267 start_codon:yes stop_codon:yes gene_type:complete